MRIRSVKPDFWKSEKVASLPFEARLLFIGLWNLADDYGRFRAHPNLIQGELFPYDPGIDIEAWLRPIVQAGLVLTYVVDGRHYGLVTGFSEHQKIDKRTESRLPPPPRTPSPPPSRQPTAPPQKPPISTGSAPGVTPTPPTPPDESVESAERSAADWKGADWKGLEGKGREQATDARVGAREWPTSSVEKQSQNQKPKKSEPTQEVLALRDAMLESPLRSGMANRPRERARLLLADAEGLVPTGLTPELFRELVELDRAMADNPGALLAKWLRSNTWREVLDEQQMKAKEHAARARRDDEGDDARPAESVLEDILAKVKPA